MNKQNTLMTIYHEVAQDVLNDLITDVEREIRFRCSKCDSYLIDRYIFVKEYLQSKLEINNNEEENK